ncbi:DNA polymerase Y family protein [Sanguibacter suaedae]|uniref:DNA polymerase Y family protein n=1 Tax=Sanguibacter suaedae TaxID=2795737 RepID=A0A934IDK0_9MICO|nr:DNA polymerase Y family protein [Sanguibacter suaedae]MBI9114969.1 DNA polymerase Y family protein [Sanguibacter suaedae]
MTTSLDEAAQAEQATEAAQDVVALRTAVLWVPDWPVLAAVRSDGVPPDLPAAVHDGRRVTAASALARTQAVRRGMRLRAAQECCPDLVLLPADDGRDTREFEPVAAAAETLVAGLEVARPGLLLLPAAGASRYHGSEEALASLLVDTVARRTGHESQVGVGDGVLAAILAARDARILPPGTSVSHIAAQPLHALLHAATSPQTVPRVNDLVDLWGRLGLRTLGDLAALAEADVHTRFGHLGRWAHRLARGADLRPPAARRVEPDIEVGCALDPPAERVDTATFAARTLAEELHALVLARSVTCGRIRICATTEEGTELARTWRTDDGALGGFSAPRITDRVRWQLEGWLTRARPAPGTTEEVPAPSPLVRLTITAEDVAPAGAQQGRLWGAASGDDLRARRATERVQGLLGGDAVLSATLQGGRGLVDQVHLVPWGDAAPPVRPADRPWPGRLPDPAPATVLPEPLPVDVLDARGAPVVVTARLTTSGDPATVVAPDATHRVHGWAGPWALAERWWTGGGTRRVHLQVELEDGTALLLACTGGRWTCEALYD